MALKNEIFGKLMPTEVRIVGGVDYELLSLEIVLFIDFLLGFLLRTEVVWIYLWDF